MKKNTYIVRGKSESGDYYKSKKFDHKPTEQELKNYIKNETPEELDCGGPGAFGSYVYLTIEKIEA